MKNSFEIFDYKVGISLTNVLKMFNPNKNENIGSRTIERLKHVFMFLDTIFNQ